MRFEERLEEIDFPVTLEVPSPRGGNVDEYLDRVLDYGFLEQLEGFNVCNNPVGRVRIDPAPFASKLLGRLKQSGLELEAIPHLTCRDSTLGGLQRWLLGADSLGIKNVLAMTGDYSVGDYPTEEAVNHINSLELITGIKEYLNQGRLMPELSTKQYKFRNRYLTEVEEIERPTDFTVGGVLIPTRPQEAKYTRQKIDAGADFFQTQITYDSEGILDIIEELELRTDNCPPILVSFTPLSSKEEIIFLRDNVPQVNIPDEMESRLSSASDFDDEMIRVVEELFTSLRDGMHDRGLDTTVGCHIIPMTSYDLIGEMIGRIKSL